MGSLEGKNKFSPRYPMGNPKQCKSTLARLTRDVLTKKLSANEARAAAYLISQQIQLFKIETPEQKDVDIKIGLPNNWMFEMTPEEKHEHITKTLKKLLPFYDDYMLFANKKSDDINSEKIKPIEIDAVEKLLDFENQMAWVSEGINENPMADIFRAAKMADKSEQKTEPPPANWKASGIGVKRE